MSDRIYFGTIKEGIEPPNLIEVQLNAYLDFLQKDVPFSKRKISGLQAVFKEVFPIESYDEKATLDFSHYEIGEPKLSALEAQRESQTYSAPLHVTFQLREEKGTKEGGMGNLRGEEEEDEGSPFDLCASSLPFALCPLPSSG